MEQNFITSKELISKLVPSQIRVYELLLKGKSTKEIADELIISKTTVSTHKLNIYRIAEVSSQLELMANKMQELENEIRALEGIAYGQTE